MIVTFKLPIIGDVNNYIGKPILNNLNTYNFNEEALYKEESKVIGVITEIISYNDNYVYIKGEVWDRFVNIGYEKTIINNKENLNSASIQLNENNQNQIKQTEFTTICKMLSRIRKPENVFISFYDKTIVDYFSQTVYKFDKQGSLINSYYYRQFKR